MVWSKKINWDSLQLTLSLSGELTRQSPPLLGGGKSGLHRIRCQVTPGGREPTIVQQKISPLEGKGEMVW